MREGGYSERNRKSGIGSEGPSSSAVEAGPDRKEEGRQGFALHLLVAFLFVALCFIVVDPLGRLRNVKELERERESALYIEMRS